MNNQLGVGADKMKKIDFVLVGIILLVGGFGVILNNLYLYYACLVILSIFIIKMFMGFESEKEKEGRIYE